GTEDDVIFGDAGDDLIEGNPGRDLLWGGDDNDTMYGNGGEDRLFGQLGDDYLHGGAGRDFLLADAGNDELLGGGGDDLLSGGPDSSNGFLEFVGVNGSIRTATGSTNYAPRFFGDRLDGGSGHDLVLGGNVTLTAALGGPLSSQEQLAYDVFVDLLRELVDAYQASLTSPVPDDVAFVDYLKTITTAISGSQPDGDDILFGGSENDLLIGHDGADYLFGDYGRDTLISYRIGTVAVLTQDWVEGGPDDDRLLCGTHADNVLIGGTSDLNLQRTLTYAGQPRPIAVAGGYIVPSCVMDETPTLDPIVPVELHGQKFLDRNGNQVRDPDEPGLNGWIIELRDPEGDIVATTTTMDMDLNQDGVIDPLAETGLFWFVDETVGGLVPNLDPGTYQLTESQRNGFSQTLPLGAGPFTLPSGHIMTGVEVMVAPSEFVRGYALTLDSSEIAEGIHFGNAPLGEVRGFKYHDLDGDGTRDAGEPFLVGWQITIQDAQANTQMTMTDAVGRYSFSNLSPGPYTVTETIPLGWVQSQPGINAGYSHSVVVGYGEVVGNLDFGNVQLARVEGSKWEDLDGDGVRDPGEPAPSQPFQLRLTDSQGNQLFTTTNAQGDFTFAGLYPGQYSLSEILPVNWAQTYPTTDLFGTHQFILESGELLDDLQFGNYQQSSVTGLKWHDLNGNGIYDPSAEPVI
ncbi:MAG TPA: SdrD B-like domain-containing protein, partial [Pirellulaceae bacterium]